MVASGTSPIYIPKCPLNEVYSECGNNACQNTCANPNIGKVCKPICKSGCICRENYLRNTKGICVHYADCDTCKVNEIFDLCGNTQYANTCEEPNLKSKTPTGECNAGCVCRTGYVRNANKTCIRLIDCIKKCSDPNEVFVTCGDTCPTTCANKDIKPRICPLLCLLTGGCACKTGFVRGPNGRCINPKECPTCKGPNEFYSCGSACDTECATLGEVCPIINVKCTERCYCKEGFARNSAGVCIPVNQCPPRQCKTDPNAIIVPCGDPCPLTCENKDDLDPRPCPEICIKNGCKCKVGYVLGENGKCIPATECTLKCKENEIYEKCAKTCPPEQTCNTYLTGLVVKCVPIDSCSPACRCKEGYLRNLNGRCVRPAQCCTDPNAELVKCPNPCNGGTCEKHKYDLCKVKCLDYGCQCKAGYVKKSSTDSTCIFMRNCPDVMVDMSDMSGMRK